MYHYVMLHVDLEILLVFITIFYSKFMIICNHPRAVSTVEWSCYMHLPANKGLDSELILGSYIYLSRVIVLIYDF